MVEESIVLFREGPSSQQPDTSETPDAHTAEAIDAHLPNLSRTPTTFPTAGVRRGGDGGVGGFFRGGGVGRGTYSGGGGVGGSGHGHPVEKREYPMDKINPVGDLYKTQYCNYYLSGAMCPLGPRCKFAHVCLETVFLYFLIHN